MSERNPLDVMDAADAAAEAGYQKTLDEHWCPHCKSFDGHTGDCQTRIAKLEAVAEAAYRDHRNPRIQGRYHKKPLKRECAYLYRDCDVCKALAALEEDK